MSEDHRVATFQTNHVLSLSSRFEQKTVDVSLLLVVIAGTLAHVDLLGFLICQIGIVDEVIVEDDVGGIDGFRCLDGKEVRVARTEADEGYGALLIEDAFGSECLLQSLAADSLLAVGLQIRRNLRSSSVSNVSAFFQSGDGKEAL